MGGDFRQGTIQNSHLSLVTSPSRAESAKWWVVTLLPVVAIVGVCYVGVSLFFNWVQSVGNSIDGIGQGIERLAQSMELGGTAANAAASVAALQPPGTLPSPRSTWSSPNISGSTGGRLCHPRHPSDQSSG